MDNIAALKPDERATLALRATYERYGYKKYRAGKFEDYELYLQNKNFIRDLSVITFHDLDGRVLALKPDVTLSIAKHTRATAASPEKLYYVERVYRLDRRARAYREIEQLGLEHIGALTEYDVAETLLLALKTLEALGVKYALQLTHLKYMSALYDGLGADEAARAAFERLTRAKDMRALSDEAERRGMPLAAARMISEAASVRGPFAEALKKARALALTSGMTEALDELERYCQALARSGYGEALEIDFSLSSDEDYYSGVMFQGFALGASKPVVTGGGYGNLMRRFGKELDGIGFAVALDELNYLYPRGGETDVDALILYGPEADAGLLLGAAEALSAGGRRVTAVRAIPPGLKYGDLYRFADGELKKEARGDA